jgi:NAD(P)-dependent dehydrogenase (short-subunit alcohol dehydrogenase family)
MANQLAGKAAIVTGGGQGAGRGIAITFAKAGADLVLVGRTEAKLEKVAAEIRQIGRRATVVAGDITKTGTIDKTVKATLDAFGHIAILVNAAQSPDVRYGPLLEITDAVMADTWNSGPLAALAFMKACHSHMRDAGGGAVVNFGSGAQFSPKDYGIYAASKAAMQTISRAAAMEWAKDKIRVNVIIPLVASPAFDAAAKANPDFAKSFLGSIPAGRMGDPETDIGQAALFLVSDSASYITGAALTVDGGHSYLH